MVLLRSKMETKIVGYFLPFHFRQEEDPKATQRSFAVTFFEPRDFNFDYKVIVTNKTESTKAIVQFHNGRGSQEAIFGDAKGDCGLNVIATRKLAGNQIYTLCAMMAHNLSKEIQILAKPAAQRSRPNGQRSGTSELLTL